uniref:Peptidase M14 domain-containing protein n=1 Tax=Glossina austeni TaxID=7395 RepID=A0A1A9UUA6_GLOAU
MIRKAPKIFSPYVFIIKCGSLFKPMPYKVLSVLFILLGVLSNSFATPATTMPDDESFILPNPKYHSNEDIGTIFKNLQDQYPHLARTYIIGKSVQDRPLHALAVTASSKDYKERDLLKPFVKFTANIHGDETLGREIILNLAQYLVLNYAKVPEVQQILNTTEIHMLPTCNPDGFYAAHVQGGFDEASKDLANLTVELSMYRSRVAAPNIIVSDVHIDTQSELGTAQMCDSSNVLAHSSSVSSKSSAPRRTTAAKLPICRVNTGVKATGVFRSALADSADGILSEEGYKGGPDPIESSLALKSGSIFGTPPGYVISTGLETLAVGR